MIENFLQPSHLLLVLVVALFVFGPKKLPELGKGLGDGIRNFKKSMAEATAAINNPPEEPAKTETTTDHHAA